MQLAIPKPSSDVRKFIYRKYRDYCFPLTTEIYLPSVRATRSINTRQPVDLQSQVWKSAERWEPSVFVVLEST